jgi:VWFA-related protein
LTSLAAATLAAGLGVAAALPQGPPGPKPLFPAGTELVTVDAVVLDRQGTPVLGLTASDFTVAEDGAAQEVAAFEAVHRPAEAAQTTPTALPAPPRTASNTDPAAREVRSFVIVFDERHLEPAEAATARRAISAFLETGVGAGDRISLVGTAEGAAWTARMPDGREALLKVLGRLQGRRVLESAKDEMSDYEAMRIDRDADPIATDRVARRFVETNGGDLEGERLQARARAAHVYDRTSRDNETTLGIVERSLQGLSGAHGRKSLILVSGGLVNDPHLPSFRRVITESRRANVAVYFLDARGLTAATSALRADTGLARTDFNDLGSTLQEARERSEGSEGLAADTGGFSVRNTNDLGAGLQRIGREASSYYLLGYSPSNKRSDGLFRRIEVKVSRPGLTVRARKGYYAPGGKKAEAAVAEGRDAAIQRAVNAPFDVPDVPLRATAHMFGESEAGKVDVLVTTEADIRSLAFAERGGAAKDTLEYLLVVAERASGEFHRFDQQFAMSFGAETRARYERTWFPIARQLRLLPGPYQARIVARDQNSGRLGSLTYDFEVPAPVGFRLSTPVISDRVREDPSGPRVPEPTPRNSFAPAGVLHCHFEVYGAALDPRTGRSNVTAGFSIRRSDGQFLATMPESPLRAGPDGALSRTFGTALDGAPPGRYEMILVATDVVAGQAAEAREPFVIVDSAR